MAFCCVLDSFADFMKNSATNKESENIVNVKNEWESH